MLVLLALPAACGGSDGVRVGGSFADGADDGIETVRAVEAGREARVEDGAWALDGLAPGPLHLELLRDGRTVGRVALGGLGPGAEVELRGLRVDRWTERAFPAAVELRGAEAVRVNGLRMAPAGGLPERLEAEGEVLAADPDAGLLVVRPADAALPDLRVLLGTRTRLLSAGGDEAEADDFGAGERVRLRGLVRDGYVLAETLAPEGVPLETADDVEVEEDASSAGGSDGFSGSNDGDDEEAASAPSSRASSPAPIVREPPRPAPPEVREDPGRGRGKARGRERGRGPGKP